MVEYKIVERWSKTVFEANLNALAEHGWRVVSYSHDFNKGYHHALLQREVEND